MSKPSISLAPRRRIRRCSPGSADIELGSGMEMMFVAKGSPTKGVAVLAGPPLGFCIMVAKDSADQNGRRSQRQADRRFHGRLAQRLAADRDFAAPGLGQRGHQARRARQPGRADRGAHLAQCRRHHRRHADRLPAGASGQWPDPHHVRPADPRFHRAYDRRQQFASSPPIPTSCGVSSPAGSRPCISPRRTRPRRCAIPCR